MRSPTRTVLAMRGPLNGPQGRRRGHPGGPSSGGPLFETLERRTLLAQVAWDGGGNGTSWEDALNWSTNTLPAAADDVTIDVAGTPSITLSSGVRAINSLVLAESLTMSGGSLAVATSGAIGAGGTLTLNGGALSGGSWNSTAGALVAGASTASTLSGVTLDGDLVLPGGANLRISGGITLGPAGRIRLTGALSNNLGFAGSQTLASGVISLENTGGLGFVGCIGSGTLTIGPGASIVGGRGVLGQNVFSAGNAGLVVQGTITASVAGGTISVNTSGSGVFSNSGTIQALGGGALSLLVGAWTSTGPLRAESGGTLTLSGAWSTTGTLVCDDATLVLGGTFSRASLAGLSRPNPALGQISITGTLNNGGGTLTLGAATGSVTLAGGTISGGTLALTAAGSLLLTASTASTLAGVTLGGELTLSAGNALRISGGLTMAAGAALRLAGDGAVLGFAGSQTVVGGEVIFESPGAAATLGLVGPGTLTLSPTTRVRGGRGTIGATVFGGLAGSLVNQGTISADAPGLTLTVAPGAGGSFNNTGTVEAAAGGTLALAGTVTNYSSQTLNGGTWRVLDGSTLTLSAGQILTNNATIYLAGSAAFSALALLATNRGTLTLTDGRDFTFAPASGTFVNTATGTLAKTGTGTATIPGSIRLDNTGVVRVSGPADSALAIVGPITQLTGATLLAGSWRAEGDASLILPAPVTTNAATMYLGGNGAIPQAATLAANTGTLTLADGHAFAFAPSGGTFLNGASGTLVKAGAGSTVIAAGLTFNNAGRVTVAGGTLRILATIPQLSGGMLTGGAWQVEGGTLDLPADIQASAAEIVIAGPSASFPAIRMLQSSAGTLTLRGGGRLSLFGFTNTGTIALEPGGLLSLSGLLVQSGTVAATGGTLSALGGGTWSGPLTLAAGSVVTLGGDHAFAPTGPVSGPGGTLALGPGAVGLQAAMTGAFTLRIAGAAGALTGALASSVAVIVSAGVLSLDGGVVSLASAQLVGGTLTGAADLTITSAFLWTGGTLAGSGRLLLAGGCTTTINGAAAKADARAIENFGTVNWTAGPVTTDGGGFANRLNATVNISAPGGVWGVAGAGGLFTNAGTLNKTGSSATTLALPFHNTGLVRVQGGLLQLTGDGEHTGDFTVASGKLVLGGTQSGSAATDFTGAGTLAVAGALTSAGGFMVTGQTVIGGQATLSGTVNAGALSIQGGTLSLPAGATFASVSNAGTLSLSNRTLTVGGAYAQSSAGTLNLRMDSLLAAEHGHIAAAGAVALGGTVHISWAAAFYPSDGSAFNLVAGSSRSGTFATTLAESLGANRRFLFTYTGTAARLTVRARMYDDDDGR